MELSDEELSSHSDKLSGQSIVVSGVFSLHSRDEYKAMIEQHGGKNVGSISSKTSFVLAEPTWDRPNWRKPVSGYPYPLGRRVLEKDRIVKDCLHYGILFVFLSRNR